MPTTTGIATDFITFSRASTATRVNASGLIESVASGVARRDFDPVTLACKGLLIEEQRTNLTLQSNCVAANWTAVGGSLANTGKLSPDGSSYMCLFTEDTNTSAHQAYVSGTPSSQPTGSVTASVYLAAGTRRYVTVQAGTNSIGFGVTVDTTNWTITGNYSVGSSTYSSSTITAVGGGIYRVTVTGTNSTVGTQAYVCVGGSLISNATASNTSYTATGGTFYYWGAQFEQGAFSTSYIPSTTATVTRSADVASVATSAFPYNASEGTIVVSGSGLVPNSDPESRFMAILYDGVVSYTNAIRLEKSSSSGRVVQTVGGSSTVASATWSEYLNNKIGAAYKNADSAASFNGSAASGISGGIPAAATKLALGGNDSGGNVLSCWIRQITYIPRRLSNVELQARTAA